MYNQKPKRLGIAHLFIDLFEKTRSETKIDLLHVHHNRDNNVIYFFSGRNLLKCTIHTMVKL